MRKIAHFDVEAIQGSYSRPGIVLFDELEKASPQVVRSFQSGRLDRKAMPWRSVSSTSDAPSTRSGTTRRSSPNRAPNSAKTIRVGAAALCWLMHFARFTGLDDEADGWAGDRIQQATLDQPGVHRRIEPRVVDDVVGMAVGFRVIGLAVGFRVVGFAVGLRVVVCNLRSSYNNEIR